MKHMTLVNFVPRLEGETTIPLGPLYIAAVLEQVGCSVDFRDYQLAHYEVPLSQESITDFLSDSEDTIGISCLFNTLPFLLRSLGIIKAENPEKTIILGGPGPSSVAERLVEQFPFIDVVVKGEGEHTVLDLARDIPYHKIKGIVYHSNGKVVTTPERERIHLLDELPFPAYDKVDFNQYDHAGVITARGCLYHCTFCEVAPLWGYHTERRSVSNVLSEITLLHNTYGITSLHINDDTFVLNRKWVKDFCTRMKASGMDVTWRCMGRINLMDEDLLSSMADSGCVGVQYGVESGSEHVLTRIGKQITIPQVEKVIELSVKYCEHTICTFMWGFPFESMADFFQTIYVMGKLAELGSSVKFLFLSPTPLSPLYREYADQLRYEEKFISNMSWNTFKQKVPPAEKEQILKMVLNNPDIFTGFYYVHMPEVEKKYQYLKEAGILFKP